MNQWIKCADKMPEKHGFYLVWGPKLIRPQIMQCDFELGDPVFMTRSGIYPNVTKWANIPDGWKD